MYDSSGHYKELEDSGVMDLLLSPSITKSFSFDMYASNLDWNGNCYLVVEVEQINYPFLKWSSNKVPLKKIPTYTLTSNVNEINCGTATPVIFTLNSNAPAHVSNYSWSYGSDWTPVGSVTNNVISLLPGASNPSIVTVRPSFENQSQTSKSKTITLSEFKIVGTEINGNESICLSSGETQTYTLTNIPANCTVFWESLSPSIANIASQTTNQASISKNSAGSFTLRAKVTNACNQYKYVFKQVVITNSTPTAKIVGYDPNPTVIYNKYDDLIIYFEDKNGSVQFDSSNFEFLLDNSCDFSLQGVYGNVAVLSVKYSSPFLNLGFQTRAKNDCGWSNWEYQSFFLQGYDPNYPYYGYRVSSFANTASSELEIVIDEDTLKNDKKSAINNSDDTIESYTIEVAGLNGKSAYKKDKLKSKKIKIKTSHWIPGVYYMKISNSKGAIQQKTIIIN